MAPPSAAYVGSPIQIRSGMPQATAAQVDHDLAPVIGLMAGLGAAVVLWSIPVLAWLLLR